MTAPAPPSLAGLIRYWLGTDRIPYLEEAMARQDEAITELGNKFDTLGGVVADIHSDFRAFRDAMTAERENLSEAGVAALEQANAKADATTARLSELDVEVGDADGSDVPPVDPNA